MTALLAVQFIPGANPTLATGALRCPTLSVEFLDVRCRTACTDFVALLEAVEASVMDEAVRLLALRPGVARVEVYPT